ncbi:hypothetical protein ACFRNJ_35175 [Streptomyces sp. NPDC056721]|uniref:hypothetical protein n=1 Tax=Streptomyces sp. NPDC056721 TaxID=3345923 RepID=UPI0036B135FE
MKTAARAGVRAVAVLCGGIPRTDLEAAGSAGVHDGPADLLAGLDTSVFAQMESAQCCRTGGPAGNVFGVPAAGNWARRAVRAPSRA